MFRPKWSRTLIVLAMLLCLFTVGVVGIPSAHAAEVSFTTTTTTKTSTVKASAQLCAILQKNLPARERDAHLCDITIVVTDVVTRRTGIQSASLSPNACYPVVHHSADYNIGFNASAGFSQSETFTYGCTPAPVISNHQCSGWTADTSILIHVDRCIQYPNGYGHTQAEVDVDVSGYTHWFQGYSDGQPNASIYDWCNGC
jgi:hypothetical protein